MTWRSHLLHRAAWLGLELLSTALPAQAHLDSLDAVLAAYVEANGGNGRLEKVSSIRMKGTYEQADAVYDLLMINRRPNLKLISYRKDDLTMTMAYDGKQGWRMAEMKDQRKVEPMSPEESEAFVRDIDFDGPLVGPARPDEVRTLLSPVLEGRIEYYRVQVTRGEHRTIYYIDSRNLREVRNEQWETGPDGQPVMTSQTFLTDYASFEGVWLARRIETLKNGQRESLLLVTEMDLNPGIMRTVFSMPEETTVAP